jgi:ubiquinone/menaquinone biosynthesis C-methylase UbiE
VSVETFLNRFFPNEPAHWLVYHEEIKDLLPRRGKVLDVGCGDNTSLARYRRPGLSVYGVDYQEHPDLQYGESFRLLGSRGQIPFPAATFDVVTAQWVLEHVCRPRQFLAEVGRVLKPGGVLVAHSVNANHYVTWLRQMLGLLPHASVQNLVYRLYGRAEHDTFPTYYRLNSEERLRSCGQRAGLEMLRFQRFADGGFYFRFSPLLRQAAIVADWLLEKAAPGYGRIYFTVVMRKLAEVQRVGLRRAA